MAIQVDMIIDRMLTHGFRGNGEKFSCGFYSLTFYIQFVRLLSFLVLHGSVGACRFSLFISFVLFDVFLSFLFTIALVVFLLFFYSTMQLQ